MGQDQPDQFLLFFPKVQTRFDLRKRLEEALAFTRQALAGPAPLDSLRFIVGAVCTTPEEARFTSLLSQASHVCRLWQNASEDTVAFPYEDDDWTFSELQTIDPYDHVTVHQAEMRRPLTEEEKDVAFHCVSSMLSASSLETSIQGVLQHIGSYYHADRVYIIMLAENRHIVTMPYEWTTSHKHSIQQAVSGLLIDRFPLLKRCMQEQAPVFLTRTQPLSFSSASSSPGPWHFTAFPLLDGESFRGFLCIENSREHPADAALFSVLIPYLLRERERFQGKESLPGDASRFRLLEMPNLRSYMNMIHTLSSDHYSVLGSVCLDIPHLSDINSTQGFEYGSKLLWYVSKCLADVFGPSLLFRTWDSEFVAFCPNTTYQVFLGRCLRLRTMLQRRYPKELRIGYTWSDGVFNGKTLVNEARAMMRCEKPFEDSTMLLKPAGMPVIRENEGPSSGLTVFLQPKIDMKTGALFGAEALVRGIDEKGRLISPSQFIEEMERDRSIRELDWFVLEQVLSLLDRWRRQGLSLIPISVNLSRITLLNSATLASVLAIQSRYPELPPGMLELEVTESAGNIEVAHLQDIVDRFRALGFRLSLDDFGSQYANLSIFTSIRFDTIKLDRMLIAKLVSNPISRTLIEDIVRICDTYGMECLAEGVETAAQVKALKALGCRYAQGFYYDRPLQIFAHSFPDEQIEEDAKSVLKTLSSIDCEVTAMNGRFYTLRIAPYRTTENSIRGLVITIIDSLGTN